VSSPGRMVAVPDRATFDVEWVRDFILNTVSAAGLPLDEDLLERIGRKVEQVRLSLLGRDLDSDGLGREVRRLLKEEW
jgi:hypothetical protein